MPQSLRAMFLVNEACFDAREGQVCSASGHSSAWSSLGEKPAYRLESGQIGLRGLSEFLILYKNLKKSPKLKLQTILKRIS